MSSGRYMAYSPSPSTAPHSPHIAGLRSATSALVEQEKYASLCFLSLFLLSIIRRRSVLFVFFLWISSSSDFFFVFGFSLCPFFWWNRCAIWIFSVVVVSRVVFQRLKFCPSDVFSGARSGDLMWFMCFRLEHCYSCSYFCSASVNFRSNLPLLHFRSDQFILGVGFFLVSVLLCVMS